jgi:AraC family transcriptional regulator, alkane utilization regulator
MDVLSEVLRVVRLSGAIHFCAEFTQPWALISSPPEKLMIARLVPGAEVIIPFHIATEGACWLSLGKLQPIRIEAGDLVAFPNGVQHSLASETGLKPLPVSDVYGLSVEAITRLQYGGWRPMSHCLRLPAFRPALRSAA